MLDAFGIQFGNFFWNANRTEEGNDSFVALFALSGQLLPRSGQINGLIRLHADVAGGARVVEALVEMGRVKRVDHRLGNECNEALRNGEPKGRSDGNRDRGVDQPLAEVDQVLKKRHTPAEFILGRGS